MSIDRIYNINANILLIFYIDVSRFTWYNKATLEEVPLFIGAPRILKQGGRGTIVAVSKAQQRAVTKYVKSKYDRFGLTMPKGRLDELKAHAEARGESVNGFIGRAISEAIERDNAAPGTSGAETEGV